MPGHQRTDHIAAAFWHVWRSKYRCLVYHLKSRGDFVEQWHLALPAELVKRRSQIGLDRYHLQLALPRSTVKGENLAIR